MASSKESSKTSTVETDEPDPKVPKLTASVKLEDHNTEDIHVAQADISSAEECSTECSSCSVYKQENCSWRINWKHRGIIWRVEGRNSGIREEKVQFRQMIIFYFLLCVWWLFWRLCKEYICDPGFISVHFKKSVWKHFHHCYYHYHLTSFVK